MNADTDNADNGNADSGNDGSIQLQHNHSLAAFNTMGFEQFAEHYIEVHSDQQIQEALNLARQKSWPVFILGGGSNIVLSSDISGLTLRMCNTQISPFEHRPDDSVVCTADAGINWHALVLMCIERKAYGIENLSLIPGTLGAAPIQNIGAYGVELADSVLSLDAINIQTGELQHFSRKDCQFGYRDSVFKHQAKDQFVITRVTLQMESKFTPRMEYDALRIEIEKQQIASPNARDISTTVCKVRQSKLPDPEVIGNAGSFFKNPVISATLLEQIKKSHPQAPVYPQNDGTFKIAAGWMIQQAGWKGYQRGPVGVHDKQALVLTHSGGGSGKDLLELAQDIRESVQEKFSVALEQEPRTV